MMSGRATERSGERKEKLLKLLNLTEKGKTNSLRKSLIWKSLSSLRILLCSQEVKIFYRKNFQLKKLLG